MTAAVNTHAHSDRKVSVIFWVLLAVMGTSGWSLWAGKGNANMGVLLFVISGWLVSLCLHEFAHARSAMFGGDITVGAKGYLTLNPLKYTHPLYSIVLPVVFIFLGGIALPGGAVFIERGRIGARWKHSLVSASGPLVNAVWALALLTALAFAPSPFDMTAGQIHFWSAVAYLAMLEVMATLLNLVPVPGLDGYGIIEPYLSAQTRRSLANIAPYGMMIVFLLLWNQSINTWFFTLILDVMEPFGRATDFAANGDNLFHFFHFSLGGFGTG